LRPDSGSENEEIGKTIYMLVGGIVSIVLFFAVFGLLDTLEVQERIAYSSLPFIIFLTFWAGGRLVGK